MNPGTVHSEAATGARVRLNSAGFWIRLFAGVIDFTILLIPFSTVVSFAAMGMNVWYSFFSICARDNPCRRTSRAKAQCWC
jgi:hypothetical protein